MKPFLLSLTLSALLAGCANSEPAATESAGQQSFASAQDAANAYKDAVQMGNRRELLAIFGDDGRELIFTGDRVQDKNDMAAMAGHLAESTRVDQDTPDKAVLFIGKDNWPFPIPIVKGPSGWYFDTEAGKEELLTRHIGENELGAIDTCRAFVRAQKEYASKDRTGEGMTQFAQHFMSTPGKHDGLYWPAENGQEISPMGPLVAQARAEGYGPSSRPAAAPPTMHARRPFHGYFFHILTSQGADAPGGAMSYIVNGHMTKGFGLVAWPDRWGASGVMTFMVGADGKVYQKNLGPDTVRQAAAAINSYNPDKTWAEVKD